MGAVGLKLQPQEELIVIRDNIGVQQLREYLKDKDIVALDTETTGILSSSEVIGYSVCAEPDLAFYVITAYWDVESQTLKYLETKDTAADVMRDLIGKRLVFHNAVFDLQMLFRNFGVDLVDSVFADTMIMAHLIDENRKVGLKELAEAMYGESARQEQIEMRESVTKNGGLLTKKCYELYKGDPELIAKYGAKDTILTLRVFYDLLPLLEEEGMTEFFFDHEAMPLLRGPTYQLNAEGLKVDIDRLQKLKRELEIEAAELCTLIDREITPHVAQKYPATSKRTTFNIDSREQLSWLLFEKLNEQFIKVSNAGADLCRSELINMRRPYSNVAKREFTQAVKDHKGRIWREKGTWDWKKKKKVGEAKVKNYWVYLSTDKTVLATFAQKYKWVDALLKLRKIDKLLGTYVLPMIEKNEYGIIRPQFLQHGTTSGRYSSKSPNCLSLDTEILTDSGFKSHDQISQFDRVACFDPETDQVIFCRPEATWVSQEEARDMVHFENQHAHWRLTDNHRCFLQNRKTGVGQFVEAKDLRPDYKLLHGAKYDGPGVSISTPVLRFLTAVQADGEVRKDCDLIVFGFSKERKKERLIELLKALPYKWEDQSKPSRVRIVVYGARADMLAIMGPDKTFPSELLHMSSSQREIFLEELWHWDGLFTRKNNYSSNNEKNVDLIQALVSLHGWRAHKFEYWSKQSKEPNFQVNISRKRYSLTTNARKETVRTQCAVWCVKVPTGAFIARRGSDTFVTGNCQNLPRDDKRLKSCIIARPGKVFVGSDFSQLEPRVFASISQDKTLMNCFASGEDFYSVLGAPIFGKKDCSLFKEAPNSFAKKYSQLRDRSKVIALATPYGRTAAQQASTMGISVDESQSLIDRYFASYPSVEAMMLESHEIVKKHGYVESLFGRKRRIPEAMEIPKKYGDLPHGELPYQARNLLNLAMNHRVQSTAASIMNHAAIRFVELCKEADIDAKIVLQVHDELVIECNEEDAEDAAVLLKEAMENTVSLPGVSLVAEPKIARNLADLK